MAKRKRTVNQKDRLISAQVILRPASGNSKVGDIPVTTDNLKNYIPAPDAAAAVMNFFRKNGFEVGELVGTSFSITAPVDRFEGLFKTKLHCTERDVQVNCSRGNKYEIDIQPLPREVAADVMAITFTPPPDFGPTKFFAN